MSWQDWVALVVGTVLSSLWLAMLTSLIVNLIVGGVYKERAKFEKEMMSYETQLDHSDYVFRMQTGQETASDEFIDAGKPCPTCSRKPGK